MLTNVSNSFDVIGSNSMWERGVELLLLSVTVSVRQNMPAMLGVQPLPGTSCSVPASGGPARLGTGARQSSLVVAAGSGSLISSTMSPDTSYNAVQQAVGILCCTTTPTSNALQSI